VRPRAVCRPAVDRPDALSGERRARTEEVRDGVDLLDGLLVEGLPQRLLLGAVELGLCGLNLGVEVGVVQLRQVPATLLREERWDHGRGIRPVRAPTTVAELARVPRV